MAPVSTSAFRTVRGEQVPRLTQGGGVRAPAIERFRRFVREVASGCWEWTGSTNSRGYALFCAGGRGNVVLAHRWSYEFHVGPIPAGLTIDHLCRNRRCVRPEHLEPCTGRENAQRYARSITHCRNGHPLTGDNLRVRTDGRRACRVCQRADTARSDRKRTARKRTARLVADLPLFAEAAR